jgi:hypothetical protein
MFAMVSKWFHFGAILLAKIEAFNAAIVAVVIRTSFLLAVRSSR